MSRPTATHVPHTVAAKDANSSKRSGLKASGASMPGKLGSRMIAVICEHPESASQSIIIGDPAGSHLMSMKGAKHGVQQEKAVSASGFQVLTAPV